MHVFRPTPADVTALVEAAIAAPSADNRHHVSFEIREDRLVLRTDDFYAACGTSHRRYLTELSYGAIAENMRAWLAARGLAFRPAWFPAIDDPRILLSIVWAELGETSADEPLASCIATRHTNRRFFHGPPLTTVERGRIDACLLGQPDVRLDWFDDRRRRSALLRLIRHAETERFRHRTHHAELFESIAFDAGWSTFTTEHLAPGALEVEAPMRPLFAALRRWPTMRLANRFGGATLLGWRAGDLPARWSPHLLAITSRSSRREAALEGGALFERVWLAAQSLGLALQPMAASAVLCNDPLIDAVPGRGLAAGWADLVGADRHPVMVFRLGRAARPSVRSLRKPASAYVTDEEEASIPSTSTETPPRTTDRST